MLRRSNTVEIEVETKSEKRIRYFLVVLFFVQITLTTTPFMQRGLVTEDGTELQTVTPIQWIIQLFSSNGEAKNISMAVYGILLVVIPMIAFFVCLFDKRSRVKYLFSGLGSVVCAVLITFTVGTSISLGAIITLVINIVGLFMTMQGVQATTRRMHS